MRRRVLLTGALFPALAACGSAAEPQTAGAPTAPSPPASNPPSMTPAAPSVPVGSETSVVVLDADMTTAYGQYYVLWDERAFYGGGDPFGDSFAGQSNGLLGAAQPGGLMALSASDLANFHLRLEVLGRHPGNPDAQWEDVVEVSVPITASHAQWQTWAAEDSGDFALKIGEHRVRLSCRGRDAARASLTDEVLEHHLLQMWPEVHRSETLVRVGSDDARYWHGQQRKAVAG